MPGSGKSVGAQSTRELGGPLSVLVRQRRDHAKLDKLLHELSTAGVADQDRVLRHTYRLVFPHAFAEEAVLWPALRATVPDGEGLTLRVEQEHQEVNEIVTILETTRPGTEQHATAVTRLIEVLREDVRDEEDVLLPRLQQVVPPARLRVLGLTWEIVRRLSPTRAHPLVARRPPGNVLAALPLSVIDRLRDRVDSLNQRGLAPGATRKASQVLTDCAHRVEQLPLLSTGEDPSTHRH